MAGVGEGVTSTNEFKRESIYYSASQLKRNNGNIEGVEVQKKKIDK